MSRPAEAVGTAQAARAARFPTLGELAKLRERVGPILAGTVLPFALVLYLALEGGGYDVVVRGEVGIAIWWIVLLGALVGALPVRAFGRAELAGVGLLLAFAAWTALGISWSPSSERSVEEAGRVLIFVGVLALSVGGPGPGGPAADGSIGRCGNRAWSDASPCSRASSHPGSPPSRPARSSEGPVTGSPIRSTTGTASRR